MRYEIYFIVKVDGMTYDCVTLAEFVPGERGTRESGIAIEPDYDDSFEECWTDIEDMDGNDIDFATLPQSHQDAIENQKAIALREEIHYMADCVEEY